MFVPKIPYHQILLKKIKYPTLIEDNFLGGLKMHNLPPQTLEISFNYFTITN